MTPLLRPAVGLMHRLSLRAKFGLVGLLLALPPLLMIAQAPPAPGQGLIHAAGWALGALGLYLFAALYRATGDSARELLQTVRRLAEGDLMARAAVDGRDELAKVAMRLNEMARENGRLIADVRGAAEEVASAAGELADAAACVLDGAAAQHALSDLTAGAVAQIRSSVDAVAVSVRETETIADRSRAPSR
ncbi:MAG: methyl-accepting chemotaxis protein [Chloroflexota bacterium]|jgi:methyl-accepting chemotaxis protein